MTSPAETLRAAATLIRDTASNATPGPWEDTPDALWIGGQVWGYRILKDGNFPVGDGGAPDPAWIALMHPKVAEPLAAWLEHAARDLEAAEFAAAKWADAEQLKPSDYIDEPDSAARALAVARQILGRDS